MSERKVFLFILSVIFYCLYSVHMWFMTNNVDEKPLNPHAIAEKQTKPNISTKIIVKAKVIPLFIKDACSALEVFTEKPKIFKTKPMKSKEIATENNTITVIGITIFLVILVLNAILDVLKVKEEERARLKLNPNGERRQSLAEFANKKTLRRESSKFGLQLFQIAESVVTPTENKSSESRREVRPYKRGESINSYLSEKTIKTENSAPASIGEIHTEPRLVKRQSVAKLIDNKLQWLPQRPVYNYHHCELRFWRNHSLKTIPYSLWYHMFRGQQTRSLNIGCLSIPVCQETSPTGRCVLRLNQEKKYDINMNFPTNYKHIINKDVVIVPSLFELCKRRFYEIIKDAARRLTTAPPSIYSDTHYDEKYENNINTLQEHFNDFNILNNNENVNTININKNKELKAKGKGYCVPYDIVEEYFYYLPRIMKEDLCNGPVSRCENVSCKKAVFDFVYFEFCVEKIILIDSTEDVILSAAFCSKSCAESWKRGKTLLNWKFV